MRRSFLVVKAVGIHLAVLAAALVSSRSAVADIGSTPFYLQVDGLFEETKTDLLIEGLVTFQEPDLGWDLFSAEFLISNGDGSDEFDGMFTVFSPDGDLFGHASGSLFHLIDTHALAGTFEITGGTGVYEGVSGKGVISGIGNHETGFHAINLLGEIVPAPGALALFGAAGLVARRRRRS